MNKIAATQKRFQHFGRTNFSIHTLSPPTISYPKTLPSSIIFHPNLTQPHPTYPNPTNLGKTSSPQIRRSRIRAFRRTRLIKMPGRSKGLAYVEFYLQEATLKALALSGQPIKGQAHLHGTGWHRHGTGGVSENPVDEFHAKFHLSMLVASKLMVLTVKCMEIMHPSDRGC